MRTFTISAEDIECANDADLDELMDSVVMASDGCDVEPDGVCPHGRPSPLLVLGFI